MIEITAVTEFEGGPEPVAFEARGHHRDKDFVLALERQLRRTCEASAVRHEHLRFIPAGGPDGGGMHVPAEPGTRGAFAVTWVEAEDTRSALRIITTKKAREP